ncbi:MAG: cytochrome c3 family protein [Nitrospirae bacterium]|nr:cytochrome c3 family protein [Nitrospirota bacterium]MCL5978021.1 cytochrome c3 family protein [Nitrospirota bacterium]
MRILTAVLAIMIAVVFVGSAMAVPPGKTAEFKGGALGKVTFDGKTHADKGLKCNDCHTKIFQMKQGSAKMKMADINAGKFCGECHNGTKAFKTSDAANCTKCHKK